MADSGPSSGFASQYGTNNMQLKRTTDNDIGISSMVKTMKLDDPPVTPPTKPNLSGIKSSLHGISYQIKLCIFICLANAKKALDPANKFSFTVVAEDPNAGKFDDIVYYFKDGYLKGSLKIQAKHKIDLKDEPIPRITLNDFMTDRDDNNPFALQKYFVSFYDQQLQTADVEGLIICTNSDIDEAAKHIWQPVDLGVTSSTSTPLDSYISSLFSQVGGNCFRLDYDKLTDGTLNDLYEMFKQCTKRTRLAKLLVKAIKSKEKITRRNALFKEYRLAILHIIDKNDLSTNGSYGFTKEFLDLSLPNSTPGYESFRKEFEEQYQKELRDTIKYHQNQRNKDKSGMQNLKLKRLYVANDFFESKTDLSSLVSFPDDTADKSKLQTFCERFRLVCDTKSEDKVDDLIEDLWRDLYSEGEQEDAGRRRVAVEESLAIEKLFKTNFDWLMNPFAKPLQSEDIKKDLESITNRLTHIKLKGISEKLHNKLMVSPFRINPVTLKGSELYEHVENEKVLKVKAYDIQFGVTVLSDVLAIHGKHHYNTLLLDESDLTNKSDSIKEVIRVADQPIYLIIVCIESFEAVHSIVRRWKKDVLNESTKQVFLIKKISSTPSDLNKFCIRDVTEDAWKQFIDENIPLCSTTISSASVFQGNFDLHPIEEVIKQLDIGKQMEENNQIMNDYEKINKIYVQRCWIDHSEDLQAENLDRANHSKMSRIIRDIIKEENIRYMEITENIKKHLKFNSIMTETNNLSDDYKPIIGGTSKKVLILLAEAGCGKSTNLTWLAWHLKKRNPSSWVVRCNLSDHCTDFKPFLERSRSHGETIINENEALQILYELIHLSLKDDLQNVRLNARKCSACLSLSKGQAILNTELIEQHSLSLNNTIKLRVFIDKFNAGEIVLLLDGFDEIAPHYKVVVLEFLSLIAQFDGLSRLYLTSRPYSFKEQFEEAFKESELFQLKPLTLQEKATILFKIMQLKMHNEHTAIDVSDFHKALCVMLISSLADMSDIPLNLMMSMDVLLADQHINFDSKTVNRKLIEVTENLSNPSFIVENFVDIKINLIYCKLGAKPDAANNPILIDDHVKKIEKVKRQHGLLALWVLFDKTELDMILSNFEIDEACAYMNEINEASEKTGIINGIQDDVPLFIHRTFAEYLAAWWIVERQMKGERQGRIKISNLESFWKQNGLRKQIDTILARCNLLHMAIIKMDLKTIGGLLSTNPKALGQGDGGSRTPLHLLACDTSFYKYINFSSKSIESDIVNEKEKLFGWTALDCALYLNFHLFRGSTDHSDFIFYLLYYGASINVEILYDQVVLPFHVNVGQAASYARYVMQYLSRLGIPYDSHDYTKSMKHFCDKVAAYLVNEKSNDFRRLLNRYNIEADDNNLLNVEEKSIFKEIIEDDSVWMLESVTKQMADPEHTNLMIKNSFFPFAVKQKRICLLKYFLENNPSLVTEEIFRQCIAMSVIGNFKNEFKFFIDLYCCRMDIKDFHPCSFQIENNSSVLFQQLYDVEEDILYIFQINDLMIEKSKLQMYNIPPEIVIDKNILSVLISVLCVDSTRPVMLKYVIESCKLQLYAGLVYYLARVIDYYIKELQSDRHSYCWFTKNESRSKKVNRLQLAFECLLDEASIMTVVEVNELLRHAITSNLFKFSRCLIERYSIGLHTVDELNGWNVLHVCVSQPRSDDKEVVKSIVDVFRCMLNKTDTDWFGIVDKTGRSILHLANENGNLKLLYYIVVRKLGLNELKQIESLGINAISNLSFCFRAIREVSKSFGEKGCYHKVLCTVVKLFVNISLTFHDDSSEQPNGDSLLLQEHAQELYQDAMKCCSLSLMHYLHREFGCKFPLSIHEADWLAWVGKSLNLPEFRVFQWIVRQYCVAHRINYPIEEDNYEHIACAVFEELAILKYDLKNVNLEELVKQAEAKLSHYKSKDEICILKLLVLTVSLGHEPATRYLCETFSVNIDQKKLFEIVEIAHHISIISRCGPIFSPIYKYLFKRNPTMLARKGENIMHLAGMSGSNCMLKWLLKNYMIKVTMVYDQNEWSFFHYYASRKSEVNKCYKSRLNLFRTMLEGVLKNDEFTIESNAQSRMQNVKEICFNSTGKEKSVIHVAFEAGNIDIVECIFQLYLGTNNIDEHNITSFEKYSNFKECYDVLEQLEASLPFNAETEELLDRISKPIDSFLQSFLVRNIKHTNEQDNLDNYIVQDVSQAAIKYRSVSTLEHLIMTDNHRMSLVLASSSSRDLFVSMMECIRRNMTNLFKVLVGHFCAVQGIQPSVENEYEKEEKVNEIEAISKQCSIKWSVIDEVTQDVSTKREYLPLLILTFAYGRLSMTKSLIEMLQLVVTKPLILLLMKATNTTWDWEYRVSVYEYLSTMDKGKYNLLHLCAQSRNKGMVWYLTKHKLIDPRDIDPENGWNAGHYCVSEPDGTDDSRKAIDIFPYLMKDTNMDCFGVYDKKGRSVLRLAIENDHTIVVEYMIKHRLAIPRQTEIRQAWNLEKINECIDELQRMQSNFPGNGILLDVLQKLADRKKIITSFPTAVQNVPLNNK